jgi:putative ATP-dependent endonuclease of OLD family
MRLKAIILENFRTYHQRTRIELGNLTAFIGRNDVGKSTILETLEIFFNSDIVKISSDDACIHGDKANVRIGCIFTNLPEELILDSNTPTTLTAEYLLNVDGDLEIHKVFNCTLKTPSEIVFAMAQHPVIEPLNTLLQLKNKDLKDLVHSLSLETSGFSLAQNPPMRAAIRGHYGEIELAMTEVPLNLDNAKAIWESLKAYMPTFALFQADRSSRDDDAEVQDPMKAAVKEAIKSVEPELDAIRQKVREKATEVAKRTIEKLRDFDPDLASDLTPDFRSEPTWSGFKLTFTDEKNIPINKRGSGVRRMILLSFFRAEAERKHEEANAPGIVYAIEEPETSQHPDNQRLLIHTLTDLSEQAGCQVLLTTHVPGLASMLPLESLRFVDKDESGHIRIRVGDEELTAEIAKTLGVYVDGRVKVLICVEGPNDIRFLKHLSRMLCQVDPNLPDLERSETSGQIAMIPLMGGLLIHWVNGHYLRKLSIPEIHIYDRDDDDKYQTACDTVNSRNDRSWATLTGRRMLESYLHPDAINQVFGLSLSHDNIAAINEDVPQLVADTIRQDKSSAWHEKVRPEKVPSDPKKWREGAKRYLNDDVASKMTAAMLKETDPNGDIISWLQRIASYLDGS